MAQVVRFAHLVGEFFFNIVQKLKNGGGEVHLQLELLRNRKAEEVLFHAKARICPIELQIHQQTVLHAQRLADIGKISIEKIAAPCIVRQEGRQIEAGIREPPVDITGGGNGHIDIGKRHPTGAQRIGLRNAL